MLKQIKNSALNVFNAKHDRIQLLYKIPFTEIYPSEFDKITTALQDEISINSISLNETQLNKYLNLVKDKIEKTYIDNPNKCFIDKWVKEFKLDEKAFPFYSDSKIIKILATSFDQYNLSYEDKKKARLMQSDFFNHALLLEAKKILKFINELLDTEPSENLISEESTDSNPHPRIFKDAKAYSLFNNLFDEFGNSEENLANYSFVFHRMKKDELIFNDVQNLQFVYFLLDLNINIDRIKPLAQIGNIKLRESIYSKAKKNI
jgi:hypothetical protein